MRENRHEIGDRRGLAVRVESQPGEVARFVNHADVGARQRTQAGVARAGAGLAVLWSGRIPSPAWLVGEGQGEGSSSGPEGPLGLA
jgi:hypothetical protein